MNIFSKLNKKSTTPVVTDNSANLAKVVFNSLNEGIIIVSSDNKIELINPVAAAMVGYPQPEMGIGIDILTILRFTNGEGVEVDQKSNLVTTAIIKNSQLTTRDYVLVSSIGQKKAVSITVLPAPKGEKIITFRDIAAELEYEGEQTEFISTASHEMRTPVASIEGYIGLCLNPRCATIDDRAKKYLEEAHKSSQHLGRLFQDLLDVTKLDDKKVKIHMQPVEVSGLVSDMIDGLVPAMGEKNIHYTFGANDQSGSQIPQAVYASLDVDFLREIINNYIENAIKYTKAGGAIWANVRGDDEKVLINITDTGIGISPDDLKHIFQKFYRVDNSETREIGGTGLGLYIVKKRAEAMGGTVWAESSFGEGSTFYLSLPRITLTEYERRKQIDANTEAMTMPQYQQAQPVQPIQPVQMAQTAQITTQNNNQGGMPQA